MDAVAGVPALASLDDTVEVVFVARPPVKPMTFTLKVQLAPAARVAPVNETLLAVMTPPTVVIDVLIVPPPQLPVRSLGVAIATPAGSVSVKAKPVSDTAFVFERVKLSVVGPPPTVTKGAPNVLVRVGAATAV